MDVDVPVLLVVILLLLVVGIGRAVGIHEAEKTWGAGAFLNLHLIGDGVEGVAIVVGIDFAEAAVREGCHAEWEETIDGLRFVRVVGDDGSLAGGADDHDFIDEEAVSVGVEEQLDGAIAVEGERVFGPLMGCHEVEH